MDFKPLGDAERLRAIGSTKGLPETLRLTFDSGTDFEPILVPKSGDWLAEHFEPGQTFEDFARSKPNRPHKSQSMIFLQPLGRFPRKGPSIETLKDYAARFFCIEVNLLPPLDMDEPPFTARINPYTGKRQILTTDVLVALRKNLPRDAFCLLAITMEDLYPHPSWNFVFGQASLRDRVGIFSFARYDPAFYGEARRKDDQTLLLRRCCKVLAHEMAHIFSLHHCIYFKCVMNGSNHLRESDFRPLHLCPVCLRKLQYSIEFDVVDRYEKLLRFYHKAAFEDEALWIWKRLKKITRR